MTDHLSLAQRLSADSPAKLERAAQNRFDTAEILRGKERRLAAVYLYGYCAEMCLSSAYFRSAGFTAIMPIDRDTRNRRMAQARRQRGANGEFLMNSDPHPIMGWAQFLYWHRLIPGTMTAQQDQCLKEAIKKATLLYQNWRPELRYKVVEITDSQVADVRHAADWILKNQRRFWE
jgi:hypothetical protein